MAYATPRCTGGSGSPPHNPVWMNYIGYGYVGTDRCPRWRCSRCGNITGQPGHSGPSVLKIVGGLAIGALILSALTHRED